MDILPAIDIMDGRVVRLSKGVLQTATSYDGFEDPLKTAKRWESEGATYLHIVDLDAATGGGDNKHIIQKIISKVKIPVQVGGGIRSRAIAESMISSGVDRIIVATLAFEKEEVLKKLIEMFGSEKIMVALDYLEGTVMIKGWKGSTGLSLIKAVEKFLKMGVNFFLLTSISRDGLLLGPDYSSLNIVKKRFNEKLFIAGGINSIEDLVRLKEIGIEGVIIGKAFYERKFTLNEVLNALRD